MDQFLTPVPLELAHVQAIVRGMYRVAQSDGCHSEELVLIREFYEACREETGGLADFRDVVNVPFDPAEARQILSSAALRETFLKSCYLLAWADGQLSDPEKTAIAEMVRELSIEPEIVARTEELVRDHLLRQMARLQNVEGLQKIASDLGK